MAPDRGERSDMGCGGSKGSADADADAPAASVPKRSSDSGLKKETSGSKISQSQHSVIHKRLRKLQELDEATKIPFVMVELRGIGDKNGFVEVCGKDEYGVYDHLHEFLTTVWGCKKLDAGDLSEDTMVPFCDALYEWKAFKQVGKEGLNNMGLSTMRLVDYMTTELGWTLGVVNGGNVGEHGEIREQQVIFKAPHPMNQVAPHLMIELRSAGYIEVCGDDDGALNDVEEFFIEKFKSTKINGHEEFCDRYYKTGPSVFKERGGKGENNLGLLTAQVCDAVVKLPGWSLVTCNGGNYGADGSHREQQLVFRWDNHPLRDSPHLIVELREAGFVEICGEDVDGIYRQFGDWLGSTWGCIKTSEDKAYFGAKYSWKSKDIMVNTGECIGFFHKLGWQMQVCSQGTVHIKGCADSREQQIILRPGASGHGVLEPHLIIELYMGEGSPELYEDDTATQVLGNQHIRMCPIGDCNTAVNQFHKFVVDYMGGQPGPGRYACDVFLGRGFSDNNLGQWTMRVCDFMVDNLGWSFVVCNVCNMGDHGQFREQQLVFRWDGHRREIPKTATGQNNVDGGLWDDFIAPDYWKIPEVIHDKTMVQKAAPCDQEEIQSLQDLMDQTFKRILTRDRVYEYQAQSDEEMPYHLEVIHAFRSENVRLEKRFQERVGDYKGGSLEDIKVKTKIDGCAAFINSRLGEGEAYLFHGTNPSSSMNILRTGFSLDSAGKSTGTMFGYGIYLAECASKSDEYARDDGGNTFPQLMAMLVCKCLIGKAHVVQEPGDHCTEAKQQKADCVIGDREAKVGTYREFIFFDEAQVVPEYTVIYRRNYNVEKAPAKLRKKTAGSTGRNWQVRLDKGWANVANDANRQLLEAMKKGLDEVEVEIAGFDYTFDLANKKQVNRKTGTSRPLRPPYVMPTAT